MYFRQEKEEGSQSPWKVKDSCFWLRRQERKGGDRLGALTVHLGCTRCTLLVLLHKLDFLKLECRAGQAILNQKVNLIVSILPDINI